MRVLRLIGIALMVLWIVNGLGHVLMGFTGERPTAWHLFGGLAQVGIAWFLLLKIHGYSPESKSEQDSVSQDGPE